MPDATTQSSSTPVIRPAKHPLFVAAGYGGVRTVSWDGKIWKNIVPGRDGQVYRSTAFGNGICIVTGTFGTIGIHAITTDGLVWHTFSGPDEKDTGQLRGIVYGDDEFFVYGGETGNGPAGYVVRKSKDCLNWSENLHPIGGKMIRRIIYARGMFLGIGDQGRRAISKDCVTWKDVPAVKARDTVVDVAYGQPAGSETGIYVGVGLHSLRMSSVDGLTWTNRLVGEEGEHLNTVLWCGNRFVATGPTVTYFSPNGIDWKRESAKDGPLTMTSANGIFVGAQWRGRILHSVDAVSWEQVAQLDYHIETFGAWTV